VKEKSGYTNFDLSFLTWKFIFARSYDNIVENAKPQGLSMFESVGFCVIPDKPGKKYGQDFGLPNMPGALVKLFRSRRNEEGYWISLDRRPGFEG